MQGWNCVCSNPGSWLGTLQRLSAVPDLSGHHSGLLHPLLDLCNRLCNACLPACKPNLCIAPLQLYPGSLHLCSMTLFVRLAYQD